MIHSFLRDQRERWRASPRRRRVFAVLAVILILLLIARIFLPTVARHLINERLANIDPYHGQIEDVDIALWRGAYALNGIELTVRHPDVTEPERLLTIEAVDIGLSWSALLRGRIVGDIILTRPEVFLSPRLDEMSAPRKGEAPPAEEEAPERWQDHVRRLSVLRFDRIIIHDGALHYADQAHGVASVQLAVVQARVDDLALGSQADGQDATLNLTGETIGGGTLSIRASVDPLAEQPTFVTRAALESVSCPDLNPLTERFEDLRFKAGTFSCFVELDAADGKIDGFVKPIFVDLDVASYKDESGTAASRLFWGALIPVAEFLLENPEEDQHAARVPIEGEIENPDIDTWDVIVSALRNAFIQAIIPGFDSKR